MKPSLQTFMSPGDTRTVPRRLYKADVNPDSDYRQWATLKHSTVDRCNSDTQLQLYNTDSVTCEPQQEQTQTAPAEEITLEKGRENSDLVQPSSDIQNNSYKQNAEQDSSPQCELSLST